MNDSVNTIIIGIGSPFGADQLGWRIVEHLKTIPDLLDKNVRFETCDRPGTLLLDYMKGVNKAILIDAIEGGTPGNVRAIDKQQLLNQHSLHSSHQLGVAETITLGEKLDLLPQDFCMYGVETGSTSQQYQISMEVINKIANSVVEATKSNY